MVESNFKDDGVRLHLQEAEFMKKEWISYVYSTISELSSKVTTNTLQIQKEREYIITSLIKLNEKITIELSKNSNINKEELKKLSRKLNSFIKEITEKFDTVDDCIEASLDDHVEEEDSRFEKLEKEVSRIGTSLLVIKTRVGVYIIILTLVITAVTTTLTGGLIVLFKDILKTLIGN